MAIVPDRTNDPTWCDPRYLDAAEAAEFLRSAPADQWAALLRGVMRPLGKAGATGLHCVPGRQFTQALPLRKES